MERAVAATCIQRAWRRRLFVSGTLTIRSIKQMLTPPVFVESHSHAVIDQILPPRCLAPRAQQLLRVVNIAAGVDTLQGKPSCVANRMCLIMRGLAIETLARRVAHLLETPDDYPDPRAILRVLIPYANGHEDTLLHCIAAQPNVARALTRNACASTRRFMQYIEPLVRRSMARVDARNYHPVHVAARHGNADFLRWALDLDPEYAHASTGICGLLPVHAAIMHTTNPGPVVRMLLTDRAIHWSVVMGAFNKRYSNVVQFCAQYGTWEHMDAMMFHAEVSRITNTDAVPLCNSIRSPSPRIAHRLARELRADLVTPALYAACGAGNEAIIRTLMGRMNHEIDATMLRDCIASYQSHGCIRALLECSESKISTETLVEVMRFALSEQTTGTPQCFRLLLSAEAVHADDVCHALSRTAHILSECHVVYQRTMYRQILHDDATEAHMRGASWDAKCAMLIVTRRRRNVGLYNTLLSLHIVSPMEATEEMIQSVEWGDFGTGDVMWLQMVLAVCTEMDAPLRTQCTRLFDAIVAHNDVSKPHQLRRSKCRDAIDVLFRLRMLDVDWGPGTISRLSNIMTSPTEVFVPVGSGTRQTCYNYCLLMSRLIIADQMRRFIGARQRLALARSTTVLPYDVLDLVASHIGRCSESIYNRCFRGALLRVPPAGGGVRHDTSIVVTSIVVRIHENGGVSRHPIEDVFEKMRCVYTQSAVDTFGWICDWEATCGTVNAVEVYGVTEPAETQSWWDLADALGMRCHGVMKTSM